MRILFIFPRYHTNQRGLIRKLKEEGHIVKFISIGVGATENYSEIKPTIIGLSFFGRYLDKLLNSDADVTKRNIKGFPKIRKLYIEIFNFRPEVIITRSLNSTYFKLIIPLILISKFKVLSYSQNPKYVKSLSFSKKFKHKLVEKFLRVKFYTSVKYRLEDGLFDTLVDNKYLTFIPFFIYPKEIHYNKSNIKIVKFLSVGKFVEWKNHESVIDAFSIINNNKNYQLTIIGECVKPEQEIYFEKLQSKINQLGLSDSIKLIKNVPNNQMDSYYISNDVFISFSLNEPASISLLEAMSFGLPVICNVSNGSAHYVRNGYNGILIPVDIQELAKAILFFLVNKNNILTMGNNSLKLINSDYNIEMCYNLLMKVILEK